MQALRGCRCAQTAAVISQGAESPTEDEDMIEFDPDMQDSAWPEFTDLTDEQYAALWERFDLGGPPDREIRAFATACFKAGQVQGYSNAVLPIAFRHDPPAPHSPLRSTRKVRYLTASDVGLS